MIGQRDAPRRHVLDLALPIGVTLKGIGFGLVDLDFGSAEAGAAGFSGGWGRGEEGGGFSVGGLVAEGCSGAWACFTLACGLGGYE